MSRRQRSTYFLQGGKPSQNDCLSGEGFWMWAVKRKTERGVAGGAQRS